MKQIKGIYKEELKEHEDIRKYDFKDYDYFIKENGGFTYSLNYIYYSEDEEAYIIKTVCILPQKYKQYFTNKELKEKVKLAILKEMR